MRMIEIIKKNKLLFIIAIVYVTLFIVSPEKAAQSASNSVYYLIEMIEVLPLIFLLTVVIEAWIPKEVIMNRFGDKSGFSGNILSLVLGSISAGPIYAAFPISKMLLSKGASITNIVIILSSWAVIKVPMLANEAKFLGINFMIVRWLLTVVAIFVMAYITAMIVKKDDIMIINNDAKLKVLEIKEDYCVGCGLCVKLMPEYYEMKDNKATVKEVPDNQVVNELAKQSAQRCPTKAIIFNGTEG